MIVNHVLSHAPKTAINRGPHWCCESTFKRLEALLESSSKAFKNFNTRIQKTFEEKSFKSFS